MPQAAVPGAASGVPRPTDPARMTPQVSPTATPRVAVSVIGHSSNANTVSEDPLLTVYRAAARNPSMRSISNGINLQQITAAALGGSRATVAANSVFHDPTDRPFAHLSESQLRKYFRALLSSVAPTLGTADGHVISKMSRRFLEAMIDAFRLGGYGQTAFGGNLIFGNKLNPSRMSRGASVVKLNRNDAEGSKEGSFSDRFKPDPRASVGSFDSNNSRRLSSGSGSSAATANSGNSDGDRSPLSPGTASTMQGGFNTVRGPAFAPAILLRSSPYWSRRQVIEQHLDARLSAGSQGSNSPGANRNSEYASALLGSRSGRTMSQEMDGKLRDRLLSAGINEQSSDPYEREMKDQERQRLGGDLGPEVGY
jgi:hypothetical protein